MLHYYMLLDHKVPYVETFIQMFGTNSVLPHAYSAAAALAFIKGNMSSLFILGLLITDGSLTAPGIG